MTNKYLEKIAKDHMLKGYVSPAWQENAIAKDHGKEGLKGTGANVKKHLIGGLRTAGRGYAHGAAGGAAGAGVGAALGAAGSAIKGGLKGAKSGGGVGALVGGIAGAYGGVYHGVHKSLRNQAAEAHKKYSK